MISTKKVSKVSILITIIFGLAIEFFLYLLAGSITYFSEKKYSAAVMIQALEKELHSPFDNYLNQYTVPIMLLGLIMYILICYFHILCKHNLMPGKEYGDSKFANPKDINKELADLSVSSADDGVIIVYSKLVRLKKDR